MKGSSRNAEQDGVDGKVSTLMLEIRNHIRAVKYRAYEDGNVMPHIKYFIQKALDKIGDCDLHLAPSGKSLFFT